MLRKSWRMLYTLKPFCALVTICVLFTVTPTIHTSKILAIYTFPGKSHFGMHTGLVRELILRGHEVTMIGGLSLSHLNLGSNYTEILIGPPYDFWKDVQEEMGTNIFQLTSMTFAGFLQMVLIIGRTTTEYALKMPKVQEIINAKETEGVYDLLLVEQFYQEPFLALALKYNIPVVSSCTLNFEYHMTQQMGVISPWSYVPHGFMPFTDRMTFLERLQNTFASIYDDFYRRFIYFPIMDEMTKKYFSHLPFEIPTISQMEKNVSVMLLNSHLPLTSSRPSAPGIISVGGMHIYPPKALPNEMQKFLDEAIHGAIYFSLGSNVQSKDMPADKLKMFLKVFAELPQRVLWKFENESIPDLPSNVMIKKWLPQTDILAHKNTKVFVTHGGLFGIQEGVHYGVPMLGTPFYTDQHPNMKRAVLAGYALSFKFQDITEEDLRKSLKELIEDPKYKRNAQYASEVFRDRPLNARDTAVYWIEYVIRHKGAPHLRAAGLDLAWYQFYLLDVIALIVSIVLIIVLLMRLLFRRLLARKIILPVKQKRQ